MATFSNILVPTSENGKVAALGATTSSAELVIQSDRAFTINATVDITIRFGRSGMSAADATFYRIPANQQTTFDLGTQYDRIRVFNLTAGAGDVYYIITSRT